MRILEAKVCDVLRPIQPARERREDPFSVRQMIRSYGDSTLQNLHDALQQTSPFACGKHHERLFENFEECPFFSSNLLCGHLRDTEMLFESADTAGGRIAASAYAIDALRSERNSAQYIQPLRTIAQSLRELDGASFVAFRLLDNPTIKTSVPEEYRQPALEELNDEGAISEEITRQELGHAPSMLRIRNAVLTKLQRTLNLPLQLWPEQS